MDKLFPRYLWPDLYEQIHTHLAKIKLSPNIASYPTPDNIFNAFKKCSPDDLKVVIIGQDPYPRYEMHKGTKIPQAMGLSFSVPDGLKIPSSLQNIFKNLRRFKHIKKSPTSGDLSFWAYQGCLLLNASLTVGEGTGNENGHALIWKDATDAIIKHISDNHDNIIFVTWGAFAYDKIKCIDKEKHEVIVSSHPSGYSSSKPSMGGQIPAFDDVDHFGLINKALKSWGKQPIIWW